MLISCMSTLHSPGTWGFVSLFLRLEGLWNLHVYLLFSTRLVSCLSSHSINSSVSSLFLSIQPGAESWTRAPIAFTAVTIILMDPFKFIYKLLFVPAPPEDSLILSTQSGSIFVRAIRRVHHILLGYPQDSTVPIRSEALPDN